MQLNELFNFKPFKIWFSTHLQFFVLQSSSRLIPIVENGKLTFPREITEIILEKQVNLPGTILYYIRDFKMWLHDKIKNKPGSFYCMERRRIQ